MDDDTWTDASAEWAAGRGDPNRLLDAIPVAVRSELEALGIEGAVIVGLATPWLEAVDAAVTQFERCAGGLNLTDSVHKRLGQAVGVERLYEVVGHLNLASAEIS
jgi:hypothetical protein